MAVGAWTSSNTVAVGDERRSTTDNPSKNLGLFFRCIDAGTTGGSEPTWPTEVGSTVVDNTCEWVAISSVYKDVQTLEPDAIIELFELRLVSALHGSNNVTRWHNGCNADVSGNIIWDGQTYFRFPVEAEGFEWTAQGSLPRPTLTASNIDGTLTALLLDVNATTPGNDLTGAEIRRIRTLKKYIDGQPTADPNALWPVEIWYIDRKATETRDIVQFELASKFDLAGQFLPKRQLIANVCQWEYRGSECGYTGNNYYDVNDNGVGSLSADRCGKRVSSCKLRFGQNGALPFGSFPSVGQTR